MQISMVGRPNRSLHPGQHQLTPEKKSNLAACAEVMMSQHATTHFPAMACQVENQIQNLVDRLAGGKCLQFSAACGQKRQFRMTHVCQSNHAPNSHGPTTESCSSKCTSTQTNKWNVQTVATLTPKHASKQFLSGVF